MPGRKNQSAIERPAPAIDPRSADVVLEYRGGESSSDVPLRDLSGADLARIVYVRALATARTELDLSRPQGAPDTSPPTTRRPGLATGAQLAALAEELVAGGAFIRNQEPAARPDADPEG